MTVNISAQVAGDKVQQFLERFSLMILDPSNQLKVQLVISGAMNAPTIEVQIADPNMVVFDTLKGMKI